jgi:hypothetical protein
MGKGVREQDDATATHPKDIKLGIYTKQVGKQRKPEG